MHDMRGSSVAACCDRCLCYGARPPRSTTCSATRSVIRSATRSATRSAIRSTHPRAFVAVASALIGFADRLALAHAARFYYQLLGPGADVVSLSSQQTMRKVTKLTKGWAAGDLYYGSGLMIQNVSPKNERVPGTLDMPGSYIGHGGDTYGFMSDNGFFPQLNASISVIVNQDAYFVYPTYTVACPMVQIAARHLGVPIGNLHCIPPQPVKYHCREQYGQSVCMPAYRGGDSREHCEAMCTKEWSLQRNAGLSSVGGASNTSTSTEGHDLVEDGSAAYSSEF